MSNQGVIIADRYYRWAPMPFRFWDKVLVGNECWEWIANRNHGGYGLFQLNGKTVAAHRLAWELWNGEIPEGLGVLHHCDNRGCCRPDHLFLGSPKDNIQDASAKGRLYHQTITHCPQGHPYDGVDGRGSRRCLTCDRTRKRMQRGTPPERVRGPYRRKDIPHG